MLDVLIIGAGPAGLMAADLLSKAGYRVKIVDQMPSPARKFLMAGRGGLNLTHSEDLDGFLNRYRAAKDFLQPIIADFPPSALIEWCEDLGQKTFTGSSGRVFPNSMKASPLLRSWLQRLDRQGVSLSTRNRFCGFDTGGTPLIAADQQAPHAVPARAVLLAMGGASWPKLGSDAAWATALQDKGITIAEFQPANCGFQVPWSAHLKTRFAGQPLKRIALTLGDHTVRGEALLSEQGLEGGAVYALSADIRESINQTGAAQLTLDLRPSLSAENLTDKLSRPRGKQSMATFLKKTLKLSPTEQALMREEGPLPGSPEALAARVKSVAVTVTAPYSIDRAISSAGGIALNEVTDTLMLKRLPGVFAAGEMLDWEAPTGGYLLQACFATGVRAAKGIEAFLAADADREQAE